MPLAVDVPEISTFTLRFFRRVVRRYFRRHFRTVMARHADVLKNVKGPLIVYGNHSSWWDPMLITLLGDLLLPHRQHYAPIDARALEQYPILKKLGIFPVEMASPRGAARFLRTADAVLRSNGVLWLTPQGRFADVREFPLAFKPGLATLGQRVQEVPLLPLAVEYSFWDERLPECLLCFGEPAPLPNGISTPEATHLVESLLGKAMYELQQLAVARDAQPFEVLFSGERGTGGAYGLIRRTGALLHGRKAQLDHTRRGGL